MQRRWIARTSRKAGAALRFCAALWLAFYIAYTPIHLYLEPHSDGADCSKSAEAASAPGCVANSGHDGDGHHERHPAAQHKFKVVNPERVVQAAMLVSSAVEWMDVETDCPHPQVFGFSGLSPPELPRCWQFFFRAALPVRAPSLPS